MSSNESVGISASDTPEVYVDGDDTVPSTSKPQGPPAASGSELTQSSTSSLRIVPNMRTRPFASGKTPKVLVWRDLFVSVPQQSKRWFLKKADRFRPVLNGGKILLLRHNPQVCGVAEPGEILAIMGESGAGKTTLLNVLTQRNIKQLMITGEVDVNGETVAAEEMKRMSAYVQQHDLFMGSMTVKEHLIFAARLRMGRGFSYAEKMKKVDEMGLRACQDTPIGQRYQKSISLGEKKRLAFAAELITDPSIMFCDEPTSGLDAFMAKQVVLALRKLADDGKTVVITIHQPSSQIFELFQKVCFMGMGRVIYLGPTHKVTKFFTRVGFPMADYTNPAEHAIGLLAVREGESKEECTARVDRIAAFYRQSQMFNKYKDRIHGEISERRAAFGNSDVRTGHRFASPWYTQLGCLIKRSFICILRDPVLLRIRFLQILITSIIVGSIYFQPELKKETVLTLDGVLFNTVRDMNFMFLFPCILVFTDELPVLMRESHANIYRVPIYFLAKNIAELPQYLMLPIIYSVVLYFMTGIMHYDPVKLAIYCLVSIMMCNTATSLGYAAACLMGTVEVAVQLLPMYTLPLLVFGGFFVNLSSVPVYFRPLQYISWYRYAFESFMINLWHDVNEIPGCGNMTVSNTTGTQSNDSLLGCIAGLDGPSHLHFHNFSSSTSQIWVNMLIMLAMIVVYRSIAMIALCLRAHLNDN